MDLTTEQACYVAGCLLLAAVLNRRHHRGQLEGRQLRVKVGHCNWKRTGYEFTIENKILEVVRMLARMAKSESNPAEHATFLKVIFRLQPLVTIGKSVGVAWPVCGYYGYFHLRRRDVSKC